MLVERAESMPPEMRSTYWRTFCCVFLLLRRLMRKTSAATTASPMPRRSSRALFSASEKALKAGSSIRERYVRKLSGSGKACTHS